MENGFQLYKKKTLSEHRQHDIFNIFTQKNSVLLYIQRECVIFSCGPMYIIAITAIRHRNLSLVTAKLQSNGPVNLRVLVPMGSQPDSDQNLVKKGRNNSRQWRDHWHRDFSRFWLDCGQKWPDFDSSAPRADDTGESIFGRRRPKIHPQPPPLHPTFAHSHSRHRRRRPQFSRQRDGVWSDAASGHTPIGFRSDCGQCR